MRKLISAIVVAGALILNAPAEVVKPAPAAPPQLSTADKVALQAQEQAKVKANQDFQQATQIEQQIENEFAQSHPGWHINPQANFSIEANPPVQTPATPVTNGKPVEKKK